MSGPSRARSSSPAVGGSNPRRTSVSRSSISSLLASTISPPSTRASSPARSLHGSIFDPTAAAAAAPKSLANRIVDDVAYQTLLQAYVPHISVYASQDTNDFIAGKGFAGGLWELLRPYGERVMGRVSIQDSHGVSKAYENYAIRFVRHGDHIEQPLPSSATPSSPVKSPTMTTTTTTTPQSIPEPLSATYLQQVDEVVRLRIHQARVSEAGAADYDTGYDGQALSSSPTSSYYALYVRRLLSYLPLAPHESFAHPVACVIAISSRNPAPIEELRRLYTETTQGAQRLPAWVDGDYLRYYVLVHDEDTDDLHRSLSVFEQMKRHLGLHCHLLRLRGGEPLPADHPDAVPVPQSPWLTAKEELEQIQTRTQTRTQQSEATEVAQPHTSSMAQPPLHSAQPRYVVETDALALQTMVRQLVVQSIIPTIERNVALWNDQIASKRRGLTGRFMSLSRKWTFGSSRTAFGGGSGSGSGSSGSSGSSGAGHVDPPGSFRPDTHEAILRKLADCAVMLRDWKLAHSTYDLIRGDYASANAWRYHASANEMAAITLLAQPQGLSSRARAETVDQMLEQAYYSYHSRCRSPYGVARTMLPALELLRLRGGSFVDDALRWASRVLAAGILGPVGDALVKERVAVWCAERGGNGGGGGGDARGHLGTRRRKAALWSFVAAEAWTAQKAYRPALRALQQARQTYDPIGIGGVVDSSLVQQEHHIEQQELEQDHAGQDRADRAHTEQGGDTRDTVDHPETEDEDDFRAKQRQTGPISAFTQARAYLDQLDEFLRAKVDEQDATDTSTGPQKEACEKREA